MLVGNLHRNSRLKVAYKLIYQSDADHWRPASLCMIWNLAATTSESSGGEQLRKVYLQDIFSLKRYPSNYTKEGSCDICDCKENLDHVMVGCQFAHIVWESICSNSWGSGILQKLRYIIFFNRMVDLEEHG